jgi:hypothetical protein
VVDHREQLQLAFCDQHTQASNGVLDLAARPHEAEEPITPAPPAIAA